MFVVSGLLVAVLLQASPPPAPQAAPAPAASQSVHFEYFRSQWRVELDGTGEQTVQVRVTVLDSLGVASVGQIPGLYMQGFSEVTFDSITIEKPKSDGRKVRVTDGLVEDLNPFGTAVPGLPIDIRMKRYTVPGLEPGDTLSYTVRVVTKTPLFPGRVFNHEELVKAVFADVEEYVLDRPAAPGLKAVLDTAAGLQWEPVAAPTGRIVQRAVRKRPALAPAAASGEESSEGDDVPGNVGASERLFEYSNFSSWNEVAEWWLDMSAPAFEPDDAIRAATAKLIESKPTPRGKAEAIAGFVAENVRYLNVAFGSGRMKPRAASEVFRERYGDCKDKYALLAAMAKVAGIPVSPALVQSGPHEIDEGIPSPAQFDHVIAALQLSPDKNELFWVDPTMALGPPGYLAPPIRDDKVLIVRRSGSEFTRTPLALPYRTFLEVQINGRVEPDGSHAFTGTFMNRSDFEASVRSGFRMLPQDRWDELKSSVAPEWAQWKVSGIKPLSDPLRIDQPIKVQYEARWQGSGGLGKDWTLWLPMPDLNLREPLATPVDDVIARYRGSLEKVFAARIELPAGVQAKAPISISLERPFATYKSTYVVEGSVLKIDRKLVVLRQTVKTAERAAYTSFRDAVVADGRQSFSMTGLASLAGSGQRKEASDTLDTAAALNTRGLAAFDRGDLAMAEKLLRRSTELDANEPNAWNNLGRVLRKGDRPDEALDAFAKAIAVNAYDPRAYGNRGELLLQLGRPEEGERDLLKQVENAPFDIDAYETLGNLRMTQGRSKDAAEFFEKAVSLKPKENPRNWMSLAYVSEKAGNAGRAREAAIQALPMEQVPAQQIMVAEVLNKVGDLAVAENVLRKAVHELERALSVLDLAALARGNYPEAFMDSMALVRGWYLLGVLAKDVPEGPKTIDYLQAAWDLSWSPELGLAYARALQKEGRNKEATEVATQALSMTADRGQGAQRLAEFGETATDRSFADADAAVAKARTVSVAKAAGADFTGRAFIVVDKDGHIAAAAAGGNDKVPDSVLQSLVGATVSFPEIKTRPSLVRTALLSCTKSSPCVAIMDALQY